MTRKSRVSLEIKAARLQQMTRTRRLKPPFECPVCSRPEAVYVKNRDNHNDTKTYKVYCKHGCFREEITLPTVYKPLDAFCKAVDMVVA